MLWPGRGPVRSAAVTSRGQDGANMPWRGLGVALIGAVAGGAMGVLTGYVVADFAGIDESASAGLVLGFLALGALFGSQAERLRR